MNRLPDFLICGAQKAGTTALTFYLRNHPGIFIPWKKELHFFDADFNFKKGLDFYTRQFAGASQAQITGEGTPIYMYLNKIPGRIAPALPGIKLIFILRNPVDRAWSHYWDSVKRGKEEMSFEHAINLEEDRIIKDEVSKRFFSYLDRGKYIDQINAYLKYFRRSQMHFILSEDLKKNPQETLLRLYNFLGVNARNTAVKKSVSKHEGKIPVNNKLNIVFRNTFLNKNILSRKAYELLFMKKNNFIMNADTRKYLTDYFEDYNLRLAFFLELNYKLWSPETK